MFDRTTRRRLLALFSVAACAGSAAAQSTLYTLNGVAADDNFGWSVALIGDLNADGRAEFAVGATEQGVLSSGQGYVKVFNGATGAVMYTFNGLANGDGFGISVGASDVNMDGKPDILVGAPYALSAGGGVEGGKVYVFNGATGSSTPLFTLEGPTQGGHLGWSVAGAGDVDEDGRGDVIAGAPDTGNPAAMPPQVNRGRAIVYSGNGGGVLWTINGAVNNDGLGISVDGVGDVNADGNSEFIVGSRLAGAKVYSGTTGLVLHTITANGTDRRGAAVCGVGDISGDAIPDFACGAPQDGNILLLGTGYATIYRGNNATVVRTHNGDQIGDRFGWSIGGGRDLNADARVDIVIGADQSSSGTKGYAKAFSGIDGALLHTVAGANTGDRLGHSVDVLGDINLDARGEFLVGAPKTTIGSFAVAGLARVYSCTTAFRAICFGDGLDPTHTTACPCGNNGTSGRGCAHSFSALGALLSAGGAPNPDTVVLTSTNLPTTSFTLYMQHDAVGDQVFHDGVLCAGGNLVRIRGRAAVSGTMIFPDSTQAQDATTSLSVRGGVTPGSGARRYYAAFYRNASTTFCPPATANVTNGFLIDW